MSCELLQNSLSLIIIDYHVSHCIRFPNFLQLYFTILNSMIEFIINIIVEIREV